MPVSSAGRIFQRSDILHKKNKKCGVEVEMKGNRRRLGLKLNGMHRLLWFSWLCWGILQCLPVSAEQAYPLGCSMQDPSFYDYEKFQFPPADKNNNDSGITIRNKADFMITRRLGTGKFSDVFEAVDLTKSSSTSVVDPSALVVLKCLKPVSDRKIRREVLVLKHVSQLPSLARILGVVLPDEDNVSNDNKGKVPRMPALVLGHAGLQSQWLCHNYFGKSGAASTQSASRKKLDQAFKVETVDHWLSECEIRFYLFQLLMALDSLHSIGIMHRDVKPRNVLIQRGPRKQRSLMLIDLGLADFYLPNQRYNVRVASRHYKSPELLVHYEWYDYALDLWGVGCILAGLLFNREPFFRGRDNVDQLAKIIKVLGTADLIDYALRYKMKLSKDVQQLLEKCHSQGLVQRRPWTEFLDAGRVKQEFGPKSPQASTARTGTALSKFQRQGMDLLDHLLVYDHDKRYTARQAMGHPFFDPVRTEILGNQQSA